MKLDCQHQRYYSQGGLLFQSQDFQQERLMMMSDGRYQEELEAEMQRTDPDSHINRLLSLEIERLSKAGKDEKPMMELHINRPQKLTVKVRIPVKEYPRYNFVGKLLGPQGQTLRELEEHSGCKISICGRGSMKDKEKEEELQKAGGKYSHLQEDLHVRVDCYTELSDAYSRVAVALVEVRKYLALCLPQDSQQQGFILSGEGYRKQLEDEIEKTNRNSYASRLLAQELDRLSTAGGEDKEVVNTKEMFPTPMIEVHASRPQKLSMKVRIPSKEFPRYNFVGKLLGPNGQTLRELEQQLGCKISICGRGSMKDKDKEEELRKGGGKFAHLNEDLHVRVDCLTQPVEGYHRLASALVEIRSYLALCFPRDFQQQRFTSTGGGGCCEELSAEMQKTDPHSHASRLLAQEIDRLSKAGEIDADAGKTNEGSSPPMIEVHTNRPQKLCIKVRIPIQEYPNYNFIGKLLGPQGQTLRELEHQTGCKIAIKGRGSMRDKDKEEELRQEGGRFAHLTEDLHVRVDCFADPSDGYHRQAAALAGICQYITPVMNKEQHPSERAAFTG